MSTANPTQVTPERIMQLSWGYAPPLILESAIRHRVFDVLDEGPKTLDELTPPPAHRRVDCRNRECSRWSESPLQGLGRTVLAHAGKRRLPRKRQARLRGWHDPASSGQVIPKWLDLNEIVGTGAPAWVVNQQEAGSAFFEQFVLDIFPMSYPAAKTLAGHFQFNGTTPAVSVLDLAAGSGVWGIALAQSSPAVRVTAVDWPGVLSITEKTVAKFGLSNRFKFSPGDLLSADFGSGHQIATLGHILHSEGEARSRDLLAKTFEALASGGTIVVAEFLVNKERTGPVNGLIFAVNMLVNTEHGNTWSFEEISSWLTDAGLRESPHPRFAGSLPADPGHKTLTEIGRLISQIRHNRNRGEKGPVAIAAGPFAFRRVSNSCISKQLQDVRSLSTI